MAFENVDIVLKLTSSDITATEALEAVGLSHRMGNFPSQLSGGELQRVSISRARRSRRFSPAATG